MKKLWWKDTILYLMLSAVIFALLFFLLYGTRADQRERCPVDIVVFGDSVFGEIRDETAMPALLENLLGKTVYNGAFGGTSAARTESGRGLDYTRNLYCLAELSRSVYSGDFGVQQSIFMKESNTEYFAEVTEGLSHIDFSGVDVFIIQQGLNDYHAGVPIENRKKPYDDTTFLGALRTAVRFFKKTSPEAKIVLLTPVYTWYPSMELTCEEADFGGGVLEDYVNAELRLAEELDLEVIDVYHNFFPHGEWEDWKLYSRDGLHPNDRGREMLVRKIAGTLKRWD